MVAMRGQVMITGGSGFLGRGIMAMAAADGWDCSFTIYSRDEYKQDLCRRRFPGARYILGDIRDQDRLTLAMLGHDTVIHAAALKYVPEAEKNVAEAVGVNIDGSRSVIAAARDAGVGNVVAISTDKAVRPVNLYGMTKAVMERLFVEAASHYPGSPTIFRVVRYGNVIGSTGSVIPLFQRQLAENGEVTVTDTKMTRFWLSVEEAIDTILCSLDRGSPGGILVPYASAMSIGKLAEAIVASPSQIRVVGPRPGEKVHEELVHYTESLYSHPLSSPLQRFVELLPIWARGKESAREPFTLSSNFPPDEITVEGMKEMIAEAARV